MMTRQNYIAIAKILRGPYENRTSDGRYIPGLLDGLCLLLADYFASDNPNFDRTKFLQACGIE